MSSLVQISTEQLEELYMIEEAGEEGLVAKLVESFATKAPEHINKLCLARNQNDHASLEATAHSFKSSASLLGADQLAKICAELEAAGHDRSAFTALVSHFDSLHSLTEASVTELRRITTAKAAKAAGAA